MYCCITTGPKPATFTGAITWAEANTTRWHATKLTGTNTADTCTEAKWIAVTSQNCVSLLRSQREKMRYFELRDLGRQPRPTEIGTVPGEHVERPYSAVALQHACPESKCQSQASLSAEQARTRRKRWFQNGTFGILYTPRPCPAPPAQWNAMRLGRSPHIDFLGPWDHDGLGWLAERAQRWPAACRARYWDQFLSSSLINEGTVSSIMGGSLIK